MLNEISNIKIQGKVFKTLTDIPVFASSSANKTIKVSLIYGRNGSGKSSIARAFRKLSGEEFPDITVESYSKGNIKQEFDAQEKKSIFVFDEDFVANNIWIEEKGLSAIVMIGEQANLTSQIEKITKSLTSFCNIKMEKEAALKEFKDCKNIKSPKYYLNKILELLKQKDGWADRERIIKGNRQNARVSDDTYKRLINSKPSKGRRELYAEYEIELSHLNAAKIGIGKITEEIPTLPNFFTKDTIILADKLLKKIIEKPILSEREKHLFSYITDGKTDALEERVTCFQNNNTTYCPYCLQDVSNEYKNNLIAKLERILSKEVKYHQNELKSLISNFNSINLESFKVLPSYQDCVELSSALCSLIEKNNSLLVKKIDNVFTPVLEDFSDFSDVAKQLQEALNELKNERIAYNETIEDVTAITNKLLNINNQLAYYDVIELSKRLDLQQIEMEKAQKAYDDSLAEEQAMRLMLDNLEAQRKRIDIAIDIINNSLKYIFFEENRLSIARNGEVYNILSNGAPVKPNEISVGERNIIGLCYFFTKIMQGKNYKNAYRDEYLIIIDDPISSYDFENKIGILSFLKYKMSQFLLGNENSRIIVTTHDLMTINNLEKICHELQDEWELIFGNKNNVYKLFELSNHNLSCFNCANRNEYTVLLRQIYDYAQGTTKCDNSIGNIMRQALEAFSTFVYKKGIDKISTDEAILDESGMCYEHKVYFKNLMYRLVLNNGSHRQIQTQNMDLDFFAIISEKEKVRTAQEVLCFIYLLNKPHLKAHIGDVSETLDKWCEDIKNRSTVI